MRESIKPHFLIVWEYFAKPGKESSLEAAYGPDGIWAQFFRKGTGYRRTKLLCEMHEFTCYLTLDFWDSRAAYEQFCKSHAQEYTAIDRECESLMERETLLGMYEEVPSSS